jgi:hypothetical protein
MKIELDAPQDTRYITPHACRASRIRKYILVMAETILINDADGY